VSLARHAWKVLKAGTQASCLRGRHHSWLISHLLSCNQHAGYVRICPCCAAVRWRVRSGGQPVRPLRLRSWRRAQPLPGRHVGAAGNDGSVHIVTTCECACRGLFSCEGRAFPSGDAGFLVTYGTWVIMEPPAGNNIRVLRWNTAAL